MTRAGQGDRADNLLRRPVAPPVVWLPTEERVARASITRYVGWLEETRGLALHSYEDLWRWSVDDLEAFWESIWEYFDVAASVPYGEVLRRDGMNGRGWFCGSRLNYAEHVFRSRDDRETAITHASELHAPADISWGELRDRTRRLAGALRQMGVQSGDRVAGYLPNVPEAIEAFLACASIGAVWASCPPEFGARSVIDRLSQIEPKVLFAAQSYRYRGKEYDLRAAVAQVQAELPGLEHTIVIGSLVEEPSIDHASDAVSWEDALAAGAESSLEFEQLPFTHPLWVLFTSGTTGLPKPIVHGHGGILLEHLKVLELHLDLQRGDRFFWFTTTGWMMWNLLVGGLLTPASAVLYDGDPGYPDLGALWKLAERARVTCFGTSATFIHSCMKADVRPSEIADLSSLKSLGSTGSPLSPEGFDWVADRVGDDVWLFSTSGGTDICTAFVGGVPTLPVYRGEIQARSLGAKVEAWAEDGTSVVDEVGELVVTEPMPSMPLFLWGDEDGALYREAYLSTFPGMWRHGDWIRITERGTAIITGRSDATINRGGVRIGTSDVYRAVLRIDAIVDAVVVDVPRYGGQEMLLFVVLRDGVDCGHELEAQIRRRIRDDCSPRHVPDEILEIEDVPRTLSGKILEVPIKRILMGDQPDEVANRASVANPEALAFFERLAEERR